MFEIIIYLYNPTTFELTLSSKVVGLYNMDIL
jgi:hypothetical protein